MGAGRSLHRQLRGTPVAMTDADLAQPRCAVCGKRIHDDRLLSKGADGIVKFCSSNCGHLAAVRRARGIPLDAPVSRHNSGQKSHTPEQNARRSASMKRWHERRRQAKRTA